MPVPADARANALQVRRQRARKLALRLGLMVLLPTIVATIYYTLIAAPQYDSVATVLVRGAGDGGAAGESPASGAAQSKARLVRELIQSRAMLEHLSEEHDFAAHYSGADADWWSRLDPDAGDDATYAYYRKRVVARYDSKIGALHLRVRAFTPEAAQALNAAILAAAERRSNDAAESVWKQRAAAADEALGRATEDLAQARAALKQARASADAEAAASGAAGNVALERAELGESLARRAFDAALADSEAVAAGQRAAQVRFSAITAPTRPDSMAAPRRLWGIATVLVTSFALMGIVTLLVGAVREHAKV